MLTQEKDANNQILFQGSVSVAYAHLTSWISVILLLAIFSLLLFLLHVTGNNLAEQIVRLEKPFVVLFIVCNFVGVAKHYKYGDYTIMSDGIRMRSYFAYRLIPFSAVNSVKITRDVLDRLTGTETVKIEVMPSALDGKKNTIYMEGCKNANKIKEIIDSQIPNYAVSEKENRPATPNLAGKKKAVFAGKHSAVYTILATAIISIVIGCFFQLLGNDFLFAIFPVFEDNVVLRWSYSVLFLVISVAVLISGNKEILTEEGLYIASHLSKDVFIPYNSIESVTFRKSMLDKLCGTGTVTVNYIVHDGIYVARTEVLTNIKNYTEFVDTLTSMVSSQ